MEDIQKIFRQQLALLAERSKEEIDNTVLCELTNAMVNVVRMVEEINQ